MASTISKSELIRQNTICKFLVRLISYNAKNSDDFLHLFLYDIVKQTGSSKGYFFKVFEKNQSFELTEIIVQSDNQQFSNENFKVYELIKAGPWIQAFEQKKLFVLNFESVLFPVDGNSGLNEVAGRLCSFPILTGNSLTAVLVIADKEADYDIDDIESLELLIGPVSMMAENFRKVEELTIAKENAEKNEQRKLSYLINLSHEIKTPVNAIAGFSQLLKESDLSSGNSQKFLDVILESSSVLVEIINNVAEISNVESGLIKITEKEVLLSEIFNELFEQFKDEASRKKLLFETEIGISGSEANILADRGRLLQVFSALLSNSFKFTYTGKIVFGCIPRNDFIEFFVSDTGIGIPDEEKNKVFDHFFQAGNSISKSFKGTGLGLTITKAVTELMGGKIWCNSTEGKGSDFHFTVPYKRTKMFYISETHSVQGAIVRHKRKKVILVAEDDNLNFALIKNFLSGLYIELLRAVNGKEAIEICSLKKVDLVLMDIKMPVMDGFTATRIIKEADPDQIIIAQTAYINDRETALASGCNDFIAKPFGKIPLINLVNSYI